MSAVTAPAEIRAMVNTRSDWCCLFEEFLTKYDNTRAYFPQLGSRYRNRNSRLYLYKQKWGSDTFVAKTPWRNDSNFRNDLIPKRPKIGKISLRKRVYWAWNESPLSMRLNPWLITSIWCDLRWITNKWFTLGRLTLAQFLERLKSCDLALGGAPLRGFATVVLSLPPLD